MTRVLRTTSLAAAAAALVATALCPAWAGLKLFGKSDETSMGRDVARQLEKEYGVWDDEAANARIRGIADKITAVANTRGFEMNWQILNTKEVNAIAVPGGFMYVTRGLLELDPRPSDDELAFVIGHETGHIARRHSMDQLEKGLGWAVVIGVLAKGSTVQFVGDLAQQLLASGYSRSDEREADDEGFKYMVAAGYDPRGAVSFMRRLMAMSHGEPPKIFASHPPSKERLQRLQKRLEAMGPSATYLAAEAGGHRLTDAGAAEIKRVALRPGDLEDIKILDPVPGGRAWPLVVDLPTREQLSAGGGSATVAGLRQTATDDGGRTVLAADYIVFDTPEAAHWALVSTALSDPAGFRPSATVEADELWRAQGGRALVFRRGQVVVALEGDQVAAGGDPLVAAIARRIAMPVATLDLIEGVPTLLTHDRLLVGDEYVGVREGVIGLSTDGWRALGVAVTVKGDRATLLRDERSITVRVKSKQAEADGATFDLEAATWAVDKRIYIPTEIVAEKLGLALTAAPESALVVQR